MAEVARYIRPAGLHGVEALHASFVTHRYRPHSHPTWTVATVHRGAAEFDLDDTQQRAVSGELFVLEPESVHTGVPAVPGGWAYQVLYLDPAVIGVVGGGGRGAARGALGRVPRRAAAALAGGRARGAGLAAAGAGRRRGRARGVDALRPHLAPGPPARRTRPEHAAVRRARRHLEERWAQPVRLEELAAVAGLSRFELARAFRAQVGLPPHAFQLDLRVRRARALLAAGEPPVAVAAACGFADQSHLHRVFKRAVGVTPGRYAARTSKT